MSKIKNGGLDQYGPGPFERQQLETAGVEGVNRRQQEMNTIVRRHHFLISINEWRYFNGTGHINH